MVDLNKLKFEEDDSVDWIFSYADMMTLLLGFFIILYSFSKFDESKFDQLANELSETFAGEEAKTEVVVGMKNETRQLRALQLLVAMLNIGDNVEDAVNKIEETYSGKGASEAAKADLVDKISKKDAKALKALTGGTKDSDTYIKLIVPNETLFLLGSDKLALSAKEKIRSLGRSIASVKQLVEVEIVGHTDSIKPSNRAKFSSNWALSAARAGSVAEELINAGIDGKYIHTSGIAATKPLFPEYTSTGKPNRDNMKKNRRVTITVKKRRYGQAH